MLSCLLRRGIGIRIDHINLYEILSLLGQSSFWIVSDFRERLLCHVPFGRGWGDFFWSVWCFWSFPCSLFSKVKWLEVGWNWGVWWCRSVLLYLQCACKEPEDTVYTWVLVIWVCGGAWVSALSKLSCAANAAGPATTRKRGTSKDIDLSNKYPMNTFHFWWKI